ncbi:deoxynucleotidyltransferase terminal-interacting protein 2 [Apodemus sylvaticus]|uniref:deoxynucleotidyltransferase terminal-interacting protein 2 n=1 Tax=Apodemus sylvaticus TaxID=10129 RepID=UPI002243238D|nr:deoxynucleotidyltransferase terminal-interacting protein 2 [Apodemus sylvaticus]
MVVTRSGVSRTELQKRSQQKRSVPRRTRTHLKSKKESGSTGSTAESQSAGAQSSGPARSKNSRTTGPAEIVVLISDGEPSEPESHASGVSFVLEPIIRVTRKRQVVITPTPKPSVRKRRKVTPQHESVDEGVSVSEAESHVSEVTMIVPSTERRSRNKAKSQRDSSQESPLETISDAECSCISSLEVSSRRTTRNVQKKLQFQAEKKDTKITPGNKKQIVGMCVDSEDSDAKQASQLSARPLSQINMPNISDNETYNDDFDDSIHRISEKKLTTQNHQNLHIQVEKQADVVSLTEVRKKNCESLDEEDPKIIEEKVINEKDSQLSLSEAQDSGLQQSVSQNHSSTPNIPTSQLSSPDREALMKSLEHRFAVVEIKKWDEEREGSLRKSDLAQSSDRGDSNEPTSAGVSEDSNSQSGVALECNTKPCGSELNVSQNTDSPVLLFLSSDESQQSDSSENERDTLCSVENSGQKEASTEDLEDTACDSALFVIDKTPGLSADKNFYLEDKAPSEGAACDSALFVIDKTPGLSADKNFYLEDKAPSEVAIEEEKEEEEKEEENSEEDSSDSDENKDESSDEEDLLSNTKSKLLKLTSSSIDPGLNIKQLGGLYINFNVDKMQPHKKTLTQIKEKKKNELLQKAVITPDFEKNYCVPPYNESKHRLQKQRRKERQKTAGNGWFGMKAPELTEELKNDLKALKMRASMDPKRFYKKNDRDGFPKYFQVGTIVDNPADFYHSRIPKKQRKKTIVEELLADSEFRRFNRRKYSEIMAEKAANAEGKKFRKKKKFRN